MDAQTRRDVIAIALNNLIESITISLENEECCPKNAEDKEYLESLSAMAANILKEMADSDTETPITKPRWEDLPKPKL